MTHNAFDGHVDLVDLERMLRSTFEQPLTGKPATQVEAQCMHRGIEVQIRFALWNAGEMNVGTDSDVLMEATARLIATMIINATDVFQSPDPEISAAQNLVLTVADRVARLEELKGEGLKSPADAQMRMVAFPITKGGRA